MNTISIDQNKKIDLNQYHNENIVSIIDADNHLQAYLISVEEMERLQNYIEDLEDMIEIQKRLNDVEIEVNLDDL